MDRLGQGDVLRGHSLALRACIALRVGAASLALMVLVLVGCDSSDRSTQSAPPKLQHRIAVTNYPLYCIVQTICSEPDSPVKEVLYLGPPHGTDPHSWIPAVEQIRDLQNVDLIVGNGPGATFATWIDKVTLPENRLVNTTDAIKLTEFVVVKDYQLVHSHGPEGEHSHSWVVPQSWLSPRIARKQATLCFEKIVDCYGESESLDIGFAKLQTVFDDLDAKCEQLKSSAITVVCSTPDVLYLTREFGADDRYLQWNEARSEADAKKELAEMRARVLKENPDAAQTETLFLWSGKAIDELLDFSQQWKTVVETDLIATPLAETPANGKPDPQGYFKRMASNLGRIRVSVQ